MAFNPKEYINKPSEKDSFQKVTDVVTQIEQNKIDIAPNYEDWVRIGFALSDEFGESGRGFFHRISKNHKEYERENCDKQFTECLKSKGHGIKIGTFFHFAKMAGVDSFKKTYSENKESLEEEPQKTKNRIDKIETYLNSRFKFRYNRVTGQVELQRKSEKDFKPLTDYIENSILRDLLKSNIKCTQTTLRAILGSDFCPPYNPFESYFNQLPAWDGKDYITQLAQTVKTSNQTFWIIALKKWIVAVVAGVLEPKIINHSVIVFSGGQGLGKTSWMLKLCPWQLKDYIYSGTINPNNKDTLIYLSQCMLINLDELENLNRSEIGSLKEMITKSAINMRKAYGKYNETLVRRASFMGSVNTHQFLNDSTGSRRFLTFESLEIDYQHEVDIDKVYSQALSLFRSGYKFHFDKDEIIEICANNEEFEVRTIEEDSLLLYFEPIEWNTAEYFLTSSQILERIAFNVPLNLNNSSNVIIGKLLKKHHFIKGKKNSVYCWAVSPKKGIDLSKYKT